MRNARVFAIAASLSACAVDPADPQTESQDSELTTPLGQPVLVINDASRPIPVIMPAAPRREPFQYGSMQFALTAQGQLQFGDNRYVAPAGKRLALDRISMRCTGSRPSVEVKVVPASSARQFAKVYLAPPVQADAAVWIYNQEIKLIADDGDTITFSRTPVEQPVETSCIATLIGETTDL